MNQLLKFIFVFAMVLGAAVAAQALPSSIEPKIPAPGPPALLVSGGCGPYAWRGPWGNCRSTPYYGRLPGGYYRAPPYYTAPCPAGYWRSPWGYCRVGPYYGRLPGGYYGP